MGTEGGAGIGSRKGMGPTQSFHDTQILVINSGTNRHAEKICLRPVSTKTFSTHVVVKTS